MSEPKCTYAFIDAANLFYGGKKSLGWSIDYEKLVTYLKNKYRVSQIYYFGGVEIHDFPFDYLEHDTVPIQEVEKYLVKYIAEKKEYFTDAKLELLDRHLARIRFFIKLKEFGYKLNLKPVKIYESDDEDKPRRKANCDVDLAFYLMRDKEEFDRAIILSGDGDFLPVLKHLRKGGKEVLILSRGPRTAREIRKFAGGEFRDFEYLQSYLEYDDKR